MAANLDDIEQLLDEEGEKKSVSAGRHSRPPSRHTYPSSARDERSTRQMDAEWEMDRHRRGYRENSRERRARNGAKQDLMASPRSAADRDRPRRRSRSRSYDQHRRRADERPGDRYRGHGRYRARSRSPDEDRYYRPSGDRGRDRPPPPRRDERGDYDRRDRRRRTSATPPPNRPSHSSKAADGNGHDDDRDKRTVFVQQLAARCRSKDLMEFFSRAGEVKDAQIVRDRLSNRSKGVGYVEFKKEESVQAAIALTGQQLAGIPVIAQLTEAEKNRQARTTSGADGNTNSIPYHRLYVGNIHFSVTEEDITELFEPFGKLEFVQIQKDDNQKSRGYGFVQFMDPGNAKEALENMNGFTVANRAIRVGLGSDRFTPESTQTLLQKFGQPAGQEFQGSSFSGSGGRGGQASHGGGFDRAGGRDDNKGGNASALDDADMTGVNFKNYSREDLMRKLARTDDNFEDQKAKAARARAQATKPVETMVASRCLILKNMFNPDEEEGTDWAKELEVDIRDECNEKYGKVVHIKVDPNTQGDCYIAFADVKSGDNALKGLNGRWFGGQIISASPVVEAVYKTQFPKVL